MSYPKNNRSKRSQQAFTTGSPDFDKKSGVFLTSRHVSWLVSSVIMVCFFVFVAGYFLGKKKAVEKFYSKIKQDSFADHIYYSMCSMYDKNDELQAEDGVSVQTEVVTAEKKDQKSNMVVAEDSTVQEKQVPLQVAQVKNEKEECKFYAELIGFGTERAARKFADKLINDNISVSVKRRRSKSPRGRIVSWYQVVTEKFNDRNDLIALVDNISVQERLKDVRIVSC